MRHGSLVKVLSHKVTYAEDSTRRLYLRRLEGRPPAWALARLPCGTTRTQMGSRKQARDGRAGDRKGPSSHRRSRGGGAVVKVRRVDVNHRRKAFEVTLAGKRLF